MTLFGKSGGTPRSARSWTGPYALVRRARLGLPLFLVSRCLGLVLVARAAAAAGNIAFGRLFGYISGDNAAALEIATTAAVMARDENRASGEKISMTAPVTGQQTAEGWRFAFVLPSGYTLASAPVPNDPEVRPGQVPARRVAVVRYSGSWSETTYAENLALLQQWMRQNRLEAASLPRVAGYDPPWTLPFRRRNEVMIDIKD